jgi:serine/threonine-protein kinase
VHDSQSSALPSIPGYEIQALLGRGGMGVVFRARHLRLGRVVALKMALAGAIADSPERKRFQREAEAVARLRHPNVVQIHDIGDADGRPFFTMEFVELKCLHKEPRLRYATAAALADDLERFLRGEAIMARPERWLERLARRARRRPALAATLLGAALLAIVLVGGALVLISERAAAQRRRDAEHTAIERAAEEDLRELVGSLKKSSWPEAIAALERARGRLGERGSADLRRRLEQGDRELVLAARLDAIRLGRASHFGEKIAFTRSDADYEAAFVGAGLGSPPDPAEVVAERIAMSIIQKALVAALDDWASCTTDRRRRNWLLLVAREAARQGEGPDPTGWCDRARDLDTWTNQSALSKLVETAPVEDVSVPLQLALAERLKSAGGDPIPFLTRVQLAHQGDFWANLSLAEALMEKNDLPEAIRFYQAAVALRPNSAVVYDNLGLALALLGRMDDADKQFRKAAAIDPSAAPIHNNLGIILAAMGRRNEGMDRSKLPNDFGHKVAVLHMLLGDNLRDKGKLVEAIDRYRQAVALDPLLTPAQLSLRDILIRKGRLEEARLAWGKLIDAGPPGHHAWDGYAELCLFLRQEAEYRRVRRAMLDRFGSSTDPQIAERAGRACLLLPASEPELSKAEALVDRALADTKKPGREGPRPYYQFAKGLAEYRRGRLDSAISIMAGEASKVMGPAPRLVQAMAQYRLGRKAEARKTLASAILSHDWTPAAPDQRDVWIFHILRREAEALLR